MYIPQIRCYHPTANQQSHVFYLLSKGNNAGQPSFNPWQNSFQVVCNKSDWFDFYFWLCYGLFKAGKFKQHQRGSVIPFINKGDVLEILKQTAPAIYPDWKRYQQIVEALSKLEKKKASLTEQIIATEKLQSLLIRSYFTQHTPGHNKAI